MKRFSIKLLFALAILMLVFSSCFLASCSSVKKNKNKSESSSELAVQNDSSGTVAVVTDMQQSKDSVAASKKENTADAQKTESSLEQISSLDFEAKVENGEQVSIEEYDGNGNLIKKVVVTGSGEVKSSSSTNSKESKTEEKKSTIAKEQTDVALKEALSKRKDSTAAASENLNIEAEASVENLNVDIERKGISFWTLFPYLFLLIIGFVLFVLNKRFNWIGRFLIFIKRRNEDK